MLYLLPSRFPCERMGNILSHFVKFVHRYIKNHQKIGLTYNIIYVIINLAIARKNKNKNPPRLPSRGCFAIYVIFQ